MTREELRDYVEEQRTLNNIPYHVYSVLIDGIDTLEQEPCGDAISRQAVLDLVNADWKYEGLEEPINSLPPVNPQRTGHWIFDEILDKHYYCSECKSMGVDYWDFCPNCGAKMLQTDSEKE